MRAEWRSVWTMCGALFVMMAGAVLMQQWCADSWDTPLKVKHQFWFNCVAKPMTFAVGLLKKVNTNVTVSVNDNNSAFWHIQLLYGFAFISKDAVAFLNSHFGVSTGTRTVHLDNIECTGRETNLTDCSRSSSISCSSFHTYAGVRCQGLDKWLNDVFVT